MNDTQRIWLEQNIIIAIMSYEQFDVASDLLSTDVFLSNRHKNIYQAISDLATQGEPYDEVMVSDLMTKRGQIGDHACPLGYFAELSMSVGGTVSTIRRYSEMLVAKAKHEKAIAIVQKALGDLRDVENDADVVTGKLIADLSQTESANDEQLSFTVDELIGSILDGWENIGVEPPAINTGLIELDNKVRIENGLLVVVAARPSMGKSQLALNITTSIAKTKKDEGRAIFFSLEMTKQKVALRLAAAESSIHVEKIAKRAFNEDEAARFMDYTTRHKSINLEVVCERNLTLARIRAWMNKIKRDYGRVTGVAVDYLQFMGGLDNSATEVHDIGVITKGLKNLALEFDCPVLLLSQLNRDVEKRPNKRPMNSDLRGSGNIEQDADVIMMIYREDSYKAQAGQTDFDGMAEIIIGKNRDGEVGTVRLGFEGHMGRFTNAIPNFGLDG